MKTNNLGYPRIGEKRELKKATEAYWKGELPAAGLLAAVKAIRRANWERQREAGIDLIPSNDFSFYDQMLDMSCLLGAVPARFEWSGSQVDLDLFFRIARGTRGGKGASATASEMTKWFDTNYHYIVPELSSATAFRIASTKVFDEFKEALELGIRTKPVLIGPVTYLSLSKNTDAGVASSGCMDLLPKVLPVYIEILKRLQELGAEWVQLDEPIAVLDLSPAQKQGLARAYQEIRQAVPQLKILLASYFGDLRDNLTDFMKLPADAFHVDAVRSGNELDAAVQALPAGKILSVGIVDGRNIWKNDLAQSLKRLESVRDKIGADRLWVAPSCSLIHSPVTLRNEVRLDAEIKNWLAFAEQKLTEVSTLAQALSGKDVHAALAANQASCDSRRKSPRIHNPQVKARCAAVRPEDIRRKSVFSVRDIKQRQKFCLPDFPTTTIGSFPQTVEVRSARARLKKGEMSQADYDSFIALQVQDAVQRQEAWDIDVLVHGEFERNDMVEYFGEQLSGFAFTENGWVQSYGSRYVKPPFIFGDVHRPSPMTVRWSKYAQSLTKRHMKGMLTGPVTVLQWSFVRDDQPRSETTKQIALALRDEVNDLESAGIGVIQIDEPAVREGLPLRRADWAAYLRWAVDAFRLSSSGVEDETQIHTHMCYCEFNDIIDSIAELDADVISIETSRSNMELLGAFVSFKYPNQIGPGVYDIHSPRVPATEEMVNLLHKAETVLPRRNLWVNPDCGLKTRTWDEVDPALKNLVAAAKELRRAGTS
ncbi:MAG: 5-methyltetrahydropteroyltriglutamate--homocysteine S-methyltransferase [Pedosphaera sp.]|nr:5-methyltetrahydropteroyltriglutamate--homocysteine S-methyltransferase [Pedosphaera sp.]